MHQARPQYSDGKPSMEDGNLDGRGRAGVRESVVRMSPGGDDGTSSSPLSGHHRLSEHSRDHMNSALSCSQKKQTKLLRLSYCASHFTRVTLTPCQVHLLRAPSFLIGTSVRRKNISRKLNPNEDPPVVDKFAGPRLSNQGR